jgi:hypothetical protein
MLTTSRLVGINPAVNECIGDLALTENELVDAGLFLCMLEANYDLVQEVVDELSEAGIATAEDARQLQTRLMTTEVLTTKDADALTTRLFAAITALYTQDAR